eukprot:scaffold684_cov345-Pavlova_lutheri.AAC.62
MEHINPKESASGRCVHLVNIYRLDVLLGTRCAEPKELDMCCLVISLETGESNSWEGEVFYFVIHTRGSTLFVGIAPKSEQAVFYIRSKRAM